MSARRRSPLITASAALAAVVAVVSGRADIVEEIVARVNDAIIVRSELQTRREQVARQLNESFQGEELETRLNLAQDNLLFDMINEELLLQQARLNFDMDKYFDNLKSDFKRVNEISTDTELTELLRTQGFTMDEFRRLLLRSNVPNDVLQFEVARKLSVSPAEIQAYYEEHRAEFLRPGNVTLREIVVLEEPRGPEAARERVAEIQRRLAAGESFAELARELSEAPSAPKGGLVGPYTSGELAPALEEQAFDLPPGEVGEPIATSYGYHLLQVEARTDARTATLEEVSDDIERRLRQEKYTADVDAYLKRLWSENKIVVNPRYATGRLVDGGPYATLEEILSAEQPLGPPEPPPPAATTPGTPTP